MPGGAGRATRLLPICIVWAAWCVAQLSYARPENEPGWAVNASPDSAVRPVRISPQAPQPAAPDPWRAALQPWPEWDDLGLQVEESMATVGKRQRAITPRLPMTMRRHFRGGPVTYS